MKALYRIVKVGNNLFATIPISIVKSLGLSSGDHVSYELIPGKKQATIHFRSQSQTTDPEKLLATLSPDLKDWVESTSGTL
jgi:antitoxin component of MazEF toxin-antitoxin module